MTLIDTHTHPYLDEFPSPEAIVDEAVEAGVAMMILPNVDISTTEKIIALNRKRPDSTRTAIGLHPTEVNSGNPEEQIRFVRESIADFPALVAIGEIGIDLYWDKTFRDRQMEALELQLRLAADKRLPAIIHCREALDETLEVISGLHDKPSLVFHSFGGDKKDVEKIRALCDPMFGINGIVTFKNSQLRETLPAIGIERIMLETDAPYLAPVPHRGKVNRPSYLPHIAAHIAASMGLSINDVAQSTTANARKFFNIFS